MIKKAFLIIAVFAIAKFSFAADAPTTPAPTASAIATVTDGNVFFTDKEGKHALDPVCGMQIVVSGKTPQTDLKSNRYYFCSDGCVKAFAAKPAEYLDKMALPAYVTNLSGRKMTVNCAVSAEKIVVDAKTPHQVYKGHDYFFCCNKCPKAFTKNPDKYAVAATAVAPNVGSNQENHEGHKGH